MKNREERILERDSRLLRNEKSWRRARIGAICLSIVNILIFLVLNNDEFLLQEERRESFIVLGILFFFWLLVFSWLNSRLGHIDSIKLYKKSNPEDEQKQ